MRLRAEFWWTSADRKLHSRSGTPAFWEAGPKTGTSWARRGTRFFTMLSPASRSETPAKQSDCYRPDFWRRKTNTLVSACPQHGAANNWQSHELPIRNATRVIILSAKLHGDVWAEMAIVAKARAAPRANADFFEMTGSDGNVRQVGRIWNVKHERSWSWQQAAFRL